MKNVKSKFFTVLHLHLHPTPPFQITYIFRVPSVSNPETGASWNLMRNKMWFFLWKAHSQERFLIHGSLEHIYKQNLYLNLTLII